MKESDIDNRVIEEIIGAFHFIPGILYQDGLKHKVYLSEEFRKKANSVVSPLEGEILRLLAKYLEEVVSKRVMKNNVSSKKLYENSSFEEIIMRIKQLINEKNMSLRQIGAESKIHRTSIGKIMRGEKFKMDMKFFEKLVNYLRVSVDYLVREEESNEPFVSLDSRLIEENRIGYNVRWERERQGKSRDEICQLTGIDKFHYEQFEWGAAQNLSFLKLLSVAKVLNVPFGQLLKEYIYFDHDTEEMEQDQEWLVLPDHIDKKEMGRRIKNIRIRKFGYGSTGFVSKAINVERSTLVSIERGVEDSGKLETIVNLRNCLQTSFLYFISDKDTATPFKELSFKDIQENVAINIKFLRGDLSYKNFSFITGLPIETLRRIVKRRIWTLDFLVALAKNLRIPIEILIEPNEVLLEYMKRLNITAESITLESPRYAMLKQNLTESEAADPDDLLQDAIEDVIFDLKENKRFVRKGYEIAAALFIDGVPRRDVERIYGVTTPHLTYYLVIEELQERGFSREEVDALLEKFRQEDHLYEEDIAENALQAPQQQTRDSISKDDFEENTDQDVKPDQKQGRGFSDDRLSDIKRGFKLKPPNIKDQKGFISLDALMVLSAIAVLAVFVPLVAVLVLGKAAILSNGSQGLYKFLDAICKIGLWNTSRHDIATLVSDVDKSRQVVFDRDLEQEEWLSIGSATHRLQYIQSLKNSGFEKGFEPLFEVLFKNLEPAWFVRKTLIEAVVDLAINNPEKREERENTIRLLFTILRHDSQASVRMAAAQSLQRLAGEEIIPQLEQIRERHHRRSQRHRNFLVIGAIDMAIEKIKLRNEDYKRSAKDEFDIKSDELTIIANTKLLKMGKAIQLSDGSYVFLVRGGYPAIIPTQVMAHIMDNHIQKNTGTVGTRFAKNINVISLIRQALGKTSGFGTKSFEFDKPVAFRNIFSIEDVLGISIQEALERGWIGRISPYDRDGRNSYYAGKFQIYYNKLPEEIKSAIRGKTTSFMTFTAESIKKAIEISGPKFSMTRRALLKETALDTGIVDEGGIVVRSVYPDERNYRGDEYWNTHTFVNYQKSGKETFWNVEPKPVWKDEDTSVIVSDTVPDLVSVDPKFSLNDKEQLKIAQAALKLATELHEKNIQHIIMSGRSSILAQTLLKTAWKKLFGSLDNMPITHVIPTNGGGRFYIYIAFIDVREFIDTHIGKNEKELNKIKKSRVAFIDDVSISGGKLARVNSIFKRSGFKNFFVGSILQSSADVENTFARQKIVERMTGLIDKDLTHKISRFMDKVSENNGDMNKDIITELEGVEKLIPELDYQMNADKAMQTGATVRKGGIDLNPSHLELNTKGDAIEFDAPVNLPTLDEVESRALSEVEGFIPVIINITPVTNLPMLLGISVENMPSQSAGAQADHSAPTPNQRSLNPLFSERKILWHHTVIS